MFLIADCDVHAAWIEVDTVTFRKMLGKAGLQENATIEQTVNEHIRFHHAESDHIEVFFDTESLDRRDTQLCGNNAGSTTEDCITLSMMWLPHALRNRLARLLFVSSPAIFTGVPFFDRMPSSECGSFLDLGIPEHARPQKIEVRNFRTWSFSPFFTLSKEFERQ